MNLRHSIACLTFLAAGIALTACGPRESAEQRHREANTPAGKVGKAAHEVAREADKAARVAGRKLDKAAHDAREGWDEQAQRDREKDKH